MKKKELELVESVLLFCKRSSGPLPSIWVFPEPEETQSPEREAIQLRQLWTGLEQQDGGRKVSDVMVVIVTIIMDVMVMIIMAVIVY